MERAGVEQVLQQATKLKVMIIGDYFLDHYLYVDPKRDELSIETGQVAYQVTQIQSTPGAAGSVVSNLTALGVQSVCAVGVIGSDVYGDELLHLLKEQGVDTSNLLRSPCRVTPTYIKPMRMLDGQAQELNRLDLKNWTPTTADLEQRIVAVLREEGPNCDAIIVADQVEQVDCGVITQTVRRELEKLGSNHPHLIVLADSRRHIGQFKGVMIKPNEFEAGYAVGMETAADEAEHALYSLYAQTQKPIFMTCGEKGQWVYDGKEAVHVPALKPDGPIDIVGAGDSTSAGIVLGLAVGMSCRQAAFLGNLVASITITKLGTTGTASPDEILARYDKWKQIN